MFEDIFPTALQLLLLLLSSLLHSWLFTYSVCSFWNHSQSSHYSQPEIQDGDFVFLEIFFFVHCSGHMEIFSFQILLFFSPGNVCCSITLTITSLLLSWFSFLEFLLASYRISCNVPPLKKYFFFYCANFPFCSTFCGISPTLPSILLLAQKKKNVQHLYFCFPKDLSHCLIAPQ